MPTTKPRFTITLDENVHETIKRFAHLQGRTRGAVVAEILEAIHPPLQRTVALLDAAQDAPQAVKRDLRKVLDDIERELVGTQASALAQMDWVAGKFQPVRQEAELPPSSNHGGEVGTPLPHERVFQVEDRATKTLWKPGLTWRGEAADRALAQARRSDPAREWILREVVVSG